MQVPELPISEFIKRRKRLLSQMAPASIAIIKSASEVYRTGDARYPFRQDNDFYYLTGFPEPQAVAVIIAQQQEQYILFSRIRDPEKERWDGIIVGQEDACTVYGANKSYPIDVLDELMPELLQYCHQVYYTFGKDLMFDNRLIGWLNKIKHKTRSGVSVPTEFIALDEIIHESRLIKSASELEIMRYAARVSVQAHRRAMQICRPGLKEYQLEAELLHEFCHNGCRAAAYESIVAGGGNGCILHYVKNDGVLQNGDLVLIDAGAEYQNYAADITRTFPVNGHFTQEQKQIYEIVLAAQLAAIAQAKPGNPWSKMQEAIIDVITRGLKDLGILSGEIPDLIEKRAYAPFYMHTSGHWLGMDVHDVGRYRFEEGWRSLQPGMVLTIEPGLYISEGLNDVDKKWWNLGIRIEDDVLITENGCEILSSGLPKTINEIEALMAGSK